MGARRDWIGGTNAGSAAGGFGAGDGVTIDPVGNGEAVATSRVGVASQNFADLVEHFSFFAGG